MIITVAHISSHIIRMKCQVSRVLFQSSKRSSVLVFLGFQNGLQGSFKSICTSSRNQICLSQLLLDAPLKQLSSCLILSQAKVKISDRSERKSNSAKWTSCTNKNTAHKSQMMYSMLSNLEHHPFQLFHGLLSL